MDRTELIEIIADDTRTSQQQVSRILKSLIKVIQLTVPNERVVITTLGTFVTRTRKPRLGRNPKTGADLRLPETKTIGFLVSRRFKNLVNKSKKKGVTND